MRLKGSEAWEVIGNERGSGLKDHFYLPLNTYNLYWSWIPFFITKLWLYTEKYGNFLLFLIIIHHHYYYYY